MKTPLSLNVGHKEINLELTIILSPCLHIPERYYAALLARKDIGELTQL